MLSREVGGYFNERRLWSCPTAQGARPSEVMNGSREEVECEEENVRGRVRQKMDVGIVSEDESRLKDDKALPPLSLSLFILSA